jgi:Zn-dependent M28 family amino/carboxypeptidase
MTISTARRAAFAVFAAVTFTGSIGAHSAVPGSTRTSGVLSGFSRTASQASTSAPTRQHVEALASDKPDGRLTGSTGERLAADYIVSQLQRIGAKPVPGLADYRVPFEFTAARRDGGSSVSVTGKRADGGELGGTSAPVRALSFSDNGEVTGQLVFAGYGIVVPEGQDFGYDSYAGLDVKDKIVLVLRYFPEDAEPKVKAVLARYSDLRYKAMAARQRGAKAILVVTGPRSPNAGELVPMSFDTALAGSGIVAVSIPGDAAKAVFTALPDKSFESIQQGLDSGNPHVAGFDIPNLTVSVHGAVERERQQGHNIVAYLPATAPTGGIAKPWIALGAHYDHLGHGQNGNSLARKEETGRIHFGADDNASGTSAVLALGEVFAGQPRRRNVLLNFWSGEEIGLIGSGAFAAKPPVPIDQLAAYLNFDMVGRMQDNKLNVQAVGTSPAWPKIIEQANIAAGFDLQVQQDPYQPTDVATFNQAGVPCLNFFTGTHVDYHRPTDTADKIVYDDLDRIVAFATTIARRVADSDEPPTFSKVDQPAPGGGRAGIRVFTGTIPDYSSDAKGLLLGGVIGGGPAEQAGLQKGDVIVEIAGQSIANVYDYTYALELLKIGQPVKVAYMRNGKRVETNLTPSARK